MLQRLCLTLILLCSVETCLAITDDEVEVDYRDGQYVAHLAGKVQVSSATALAVLLDFEHMTVFLPGLDESRIVAHQGNQYQVMQRGKVSFGPFEMPFESLRRIEVIDGSRIVSVGQGGSARRLKSEMRLQPLSGNLCEFDYRIEMTPENWLPASLGVGLMRHQLAQQFTALIHEMQRRQHPPKGQPGSGQ
ncbi:MAG: hypothetical protein LWW83_11910 [Azonexaceae bacterium]|nr:hypothetical protein [Azonexaceae bacterium]